MLLAACGTPESVSEGDAVTTGFVTKGGLDGPAVPVGPFLNGALPSTTPNSVVDGDWTTDPAFPSLDLGSTSIIASNPADYRVYAGSLDGQVVAFENDPGVNSVQNFIDLRDRVALVFEGGLLALVFHPDFGQPGSPYRNSFYVYYSSHCPLDSTRNAPDLGACDPGYPTDNWVFGFFDVWLRLSRFEVFDGTLVGDPSSEQVLLNVRLYDGIHRGGGLGFDGNGHLYLSIGDLGDADTAQSIADNFRGSVLRMAVNVTDNGDGTWTCPPGSHQPRRIFDTADEISGRYYCIPDDNGWIDPGGSVFEEYCAIGLRNPFRLDVDSSTGRVWVADVGESDREEVDVVECGNNYGWPFREGFIGGPQGAPPSYLGVLTDPVVDFTRDQASSIIGGVVYRGSRFPDLDGRYLVGDFVTNQIWAVDFDDATNTGTKTYLTSFSGSNLASWGQTRDGDVLLGTVYSSGLIYALDRTGAPGPDAPALLSQTGAFSNLATATPSSFWVPYTLNQPFWSDGAVKFRFLALPNDGIRNTLSEKVSFSELDDWDFPVGTVLMKHFELSLSEVFPNLKVRLETRLMVHGDDGQWYGLTYRWRPDESDADLLTTSETANYTIALASGGTRQQTWHFPSRSECLICHRDVSGGALGPTTQQLNGDFAYQATGRIDNQLQTWNDLGMFSPALNNATIPSLVRAPPLDDVTAPLQDRARSWLDSNCSYCHRPGGVNAGFDARYTTPFEDQALVGTGVRDDLGTPGTVVLYPGDPMRSAILVRAGAVGPIAMPPLAKARSEVAALTILSEWIERLPSSAGNRAPILVDPGAQMNESGNFVSLDLAATDADGDALYFDASNLPEGLILNHDSGLIIGNLTTSGSWSVTVSASDGPAVSAATFQWNVTSTCGNGSPPPCEIVDPPDCSAHRGRAPFDPLVVLGLLAVLWVRRRALP